MMFSSISRQETVLFVADKFNYKTELKVIVTTKVTIRQHSAMTEQDHMHHV